ncbi:hypothetical protein H4R26_000480 [Coemansia thaxteri]|uniref:Uncharacterized protein n=1 Tax=Coemansia thaxteri TaxID=2663907 RepID=A0A9W8BML9_9FUNG|nr:hypothetical protein H4R26_000480 [Coemansia thaxteri]
MVLHIVREAFLSEYGVQDRYHRLAYLQHIFRHMLISRAWRRALQPYLDNYLIIRLKRKPRKNFLQYGSALVNLVPRWPPFPSGRRRREAEQLVGKMRHSDGSALCYRSNIPLMATARAIDRARTIVLAVEGEMRQAHIDKFLVASGFCQYVWRNARTLCFQLEVESTAYPFEETVQKILAHAPNIVSYYMARPRQTLAPVKVSLETAFGQHCRQLERIEIHIAISCYDIPAVLPALTSLSLSLSTSSDSETVALPRLASSSLKRLSLYNVEADVLHSMFYGSTCGDDGPIVFAELTLLKLCLRTHLVGILESVVEQPMAMRPLVFPQLESAHIFGYQHNIPAALFQALSSAPVRDLYIYLAIRDATHLDLPRMTQLRSLRMYLPQLDAIQPVLSSVFTSKNKLQSIVIYTHLRLEGKLPDCIALDNMRSLNLGALISFSQVRRTIAQLPRLVFFKTMLAKDATLDSTLSLDDARRTVLADCAAISMSLQVLKLWHYERLWHGDGNVNLLAAKVVSLLACLPSLARFKCRTNTQTMRGILMSVLVDQDVAYTAPHLLTDATVDARAYDKLYDAFSKHSEA